MFSTPRNRSPTSKLNDNKDNLQLIFDDAWQEVTRELPHFRQNSRKKKHKRPMRKQKQRKKDMAMENVIKQNEQQGRETQKIDHS